MRPNLQSKPSKMNWRCESSGRGLLCKPEDLSSNSSPAKKREYVPGEVQDIYIRGSDQLNFRSRQ
jgi:hypothetical protein